MNTAQRREASRSGTKESERTRRRARGRRAAAGPCAASPFSRPGHVSMAGGSLRLGRVLLLGRELALHVAEQVGEVAAHLDAVDFDAEGEAAGVGGQGPDR